MMEMEIETDAETVDVLPTAQQTGKYKLVKCMDCGKAFPYPSNVGGRPRRCPDCKRIYNNKCLREYRARLKQKAEVKRLVDISEAKRKEREELVRRELALKIASRRNHAQERRQMLANLRRRDKLAPNPKTEIIERNGIIIERRGTVPAGCHAADFIRHNT